MKTEISALPFLPKLRTLDAMREASRKCRGCPLYKNATQTVFGMGSELARVMFVGEQPGNEEDRQGAPFVGPARRVLDKALIAAGIDRGDTYVTNVVKHFKWVAKGSRRLHKKPSAREIARASRGSKKKSRSSSRRCSCYWARARRKRSSEKIFA